MPQLGTEPSPRLRAPGSYPSSAIPKVLPSVERTIGNPDCTSGIRASRPTCAFALRHSKAAHRDDNDLKAGPAVRRGRATELARRLAEHRTPRGARLMLAVGQAGITWQLARAWPGTRTRERQLKARGSAARRCPLCGITPRPGDLPATPTAASPGL